MDHLQVIIQVKQEAQAGLCLNLAGKLWVNIRTMFNPIKIKVFKRETSLQNKQKSHKNPGISVFTFALDPI